MASPVLTLRLICRLVGDRHILVFFSHLSGGQYLIGDYNTERDKFLVDAHGLFTFGPCRDA